MVKAMTAAAAIPHFYLVDELKMDSLVKLKNNLKDFYIEEGVKLTYLPLMIKALSVALLKYPLMNSTCNEDASTICCKGESFSEVCVPSLCISYCMIFCISSCISLFISDDVSALTQCPQPTYSPYSSSQLLRSHLAVRRFKVSFSFSTFLPFILVLRHQVVTFLVS